MGTGAHDEDREEPTILYKTKVVQFLGRSVPIILQNDNGPCPLLAICNVLLLRNNVNLSLDMTEISLQRLLSLVAERLLDANSNIENKDDEYVRNQQQNIADAIELLPRLATGLDVNVRFRHIHDFEFTPECAVFDLLDIGLVHGWLFDPQDEDTSKYIGANSYNTLVEKLVELQASKTENVASTFAEDDIDFAAATTATLGVPSPSMDILSRTKSFEDLEVPALQDCKGRKGDAEEAAQLLHALEISKGENSPGHVSTGSDFGIAATYGEDSNLENPFMVTGVSKSNMQYVSDSDGLRIDEDEKSQDQRNSSSAALLGPAFSLSTDKDGLQPGVGSFDDIMLGGSFVEVTSDGNELDSNVSSCSDGKKHEGSPSLLTTTDMDMHGVEVEGMEREEDGVFTGSTSSYVLPDSMKEEDSRLSSTESSHSLSQSPLFDEELISYPFDVKTPVLHNGTEVIPADVRAALEDLKEGGSVSEQESTTFISDGMVDGNGIDDNRSLSLDGSEPLYEGEANLIHPMTSGIESGEPLYEGEAILAESLDRGELVEDKVSTSWSSVEGSKFQMQEESISQIDEGTIIENFLDRYASQLTYYGLFSLQEGLKERELCVFFRNNHFSTMFKYNGDLYLLATDQGYLNQPDLVWEKLHEVHGDSVFVTGNFSVFQPDQSSSLWNEHDAVSATADYMSSHQIDNVGAQEEGGLSNYHSDLQLAMALQQQEFEQQQQQQQQQGRTQSPASTQSLVYGSRTPTRAEGGRLITGPKSSTVPPKQETKSKERCVIM